MDRSYTYTRADLSSLPTATSGTITAASATAWTWEDAYVESLFLTSDVAGFTPSRVSDDLEVQLELTAISAASPTNAVGVMITDGARGLAISVGTTLSIVDMQDCTVEVPWDWTEHSVQRLSTVNLRVRKVGSARWTVHLNGQLLATIPYRLAPVDTAGLGARWRVGLLDGATSCTFTAIAYETGLNRCVAPSELVDQLKDTLPPELLPEYNAYMRGVLAAIVGLTRHGYLSCEEVPRLRGCERLAIDTVELTVDNYADWDETTAYITPYVVRNRIRLDTATNGYIQVEWPNARTDNLPDVEYGWTGYFTLRGAATYGSDDETGFYVMVDNGTKLFPVGLYKYGTSGYGWRLGYGADTVGADPFPVVADATARIDLRATTSHVLLMVDGRVVSRALYSDLPASVGTFDGFVSMGWSRAGGASMDVEGFTAGMYLSDLSSRMHLRQVCAERVMFASGAERPDELRAWLDFRTRTIESRGTKRNMLVELGRMGYTKHVFVTVAAEEAGWILDVTYPDISPVWLDESGYLNGVYVEVGNTGPNWSAERLCELVAQYLVPVSVLERVYYICICTPLTDAVTAGTSVDIDVESVRGFEVGQSVEVVTYDRTTVNETTIEAISGLTVTLAELTDSFSYSASAPPYLRRVVTDTRRFR